MKEQWAECLVQVEACWLDDVLVQCKDLCGDIIITKTSGKKAFQQMVECCQLLFSTLKTPTKNCV